MNKIQDFDIQHFDIALYFFVKFKLVLSTAKRHYTIAKLQTYANVDLSKGQS